MNASLLQYCKDQLAAGYSEDQIREALLKQGWDAVMSDDILEQAKQQQEMAPSKAETVNPIAVGMDKTSEVQVEAKPDEAEAVVQEQPVAEEQVKTDDLPSSETQASSGGGLTSSDAVSDGVTKAEAARELEPVVVDNIPEVTPTEATPVERVSEAAPVTAAPVADVEPTTETPVEGMNQNTLAPAEEIKTDEAVMPAATPVAAAASASSLTEAPVISPTEMVNEMTSTPEPTVATPPPTINSMAASGSAEAVSNDQAAGTWQAEEMPKRSGSGVGKMILVVVLVMLLFGAAGGGVWGYFNIWMSPERILAQALENEMNDPLVSAEYKTTFTTEMRSVDESKISSLWPTDSRVLGVSTSLPLMEDEQLPERVVFKADIEGAFDMSDVENVQYEAAMDVSVDGIDDLYGDVDTVGFDWKMDGQDMLAGRVRMPDENMGFWSEYLNKWISINIKELEEELGTEIYEEDDMAVSQEQSQAIQEMVWNSNVAQVTETLPNGELDGQEMYRYRLEIDREAFINLVIEATQELMGDEYTLTESDKTEMREAMQSVKNIGAELWVGRDDMRFHRLVVSLNVSDLEYEFEGTVLVDMSWWAINEPVDVEIPASAVDYKEVMEAYEQYVYAQYSDLYGEMDMLEEGAEL